jgi:hypothetical protein
MEMLRLVVTPRGKGYVAVSRDPALTAVGSSAVEAAENARVTALALFAKASRPNKMLVRINQPGVCTIAMQPIEKPFSFEPNDEPEWRYVASVRGDGGPTKAAGD